MSRFEVKLSDKQKALHQKAMVLSKTFRKCEYDLVEVLREVDQVKLFRNLGYASLFRYDPVVIAKRIMAKKKSKSKDQRSTSNAGQSTLSKQSDSKTVSINTVSNNKKTAEAKPKREFNPSSKPKSKREPIPAAIKHQVYLKYEGRCSFVDACGERCTNSRYLHIHHIQPVWLGGGNELENLSLLCSSHHELVHQLSFPIEGQINWLRSTVKEYLAS